MIELIKQIKSLDDLLQVYKVVDNINIINNTSDYLLNERIFLKNKLYKILATQKNKICIDNKQNINLTHLFAKHIFTTFELNNILLKYPNINRNLGTVPYEFLEFVNNKKDVAILLYDIFAKYACELNYDYEENKNIINQKLVLLKTEIEKITNVNVDASYVGNGVNGNGYKITVASNKNLKCFFYKVFYPHDNSHDKNNEYRHGAMIEPAYAIYANHNGYHNQFVKFFMGRIASPFEKDGFMLTDFVENKSKKENSLYNKKIINLKIEYITIADSEIRRFDNKKNNKIVDFGGLKISSIKELQNKQIRKIISVVLNHINVNFNYKTIGYTWKIPANNWKSLRNYISRIDVKLFIVALKIIESEIHIMPKTVLDDLRKINALSFKEHAVNIEKKLQSNNLFQTRLDALNNTINQFQLRIKTKKDAEKDALGYIILDLYNKRQCVFRYNQSGKILHIRLEKEEDHSFKTLIELKNKEIEKTKFQLKF